MTRETKIPWWGWIWGLCLLPEMYVLSIFPVVWLLDHFTTSSPDWFLRFYSPLIWAMDEWEWFGDPILWILEQMGIP